MCYLSMYEHYTLPQQFKPSLHIIIVITIIVMNVFNLSGQPLFFSILTCSFNMQMQWHSDSDSEEDGAMEVDTDGMGDGLPSIDDVLHKRDSRRKRRLHKQTSNVSDEWFLDFCCFFAGQDLISMHNGNLFRDLLPEVPIQ